MMLHSLTDGFFRPLTTALALTMMLTGCQWPADPERSLTAARERGALRVGVVANPPWVEVPDPAAPVGLESELVREFAERQDLDIQWHHRGVEQLVESLRRHELDLLIGGFSATTPGAPRSARPLSISTNATSRAHWVNMSSSRRPARMPCS
ncbi:transporter substrate-binding domain-containing protein [Halopseudomonas sp. Lyrl_26]|uniref:transporter substrate-binding domain-containing protein n=1 Tax=Halopseudomonas sp. Lyrl_26 TaxID=3110923 RepID=UPI003F7F22D2